MAADSEEKYQSTNSKPSSDASCSEEKPWFENFEDADNIILVKSECLSEESNDELEPEPAVNFLNIDIKDQMSENHEDNKHIEDDNADAYPDIKRIDITEFPLENQSLNGDDDYDDSSNDVDAVEQENNSLETEMIYLPDFPLSEQTISEKEDPAINKDDVKYLSGMSDWNLFGQATNVKEMWINPIHLCPLCGEMIKTGQLLSHSELHSVEKIMCFLCLREFKCNSKLKWHIKVIHMGTKEYACEFCNKIFPRQGNLTEHMRIHNGDKKHKCTVCPKMFSTNSMLLRHLKTHTGERDWICPICDKGFAQKGNLMKHKCFLSATKDCVCEVCNKAFKGKYALGVHIKIHGERKQLNCQYCPKTCFTITKLKEHLKRMHPGMPAPDGSIPEKRLPAERKFKCQVCGEKAYTSKAALGYHMNGAHPDHVDTSIQHFFQCELCSKTLTGRQSYERHMKTHFAERTLQCRLCDKKFATKMCRSIHEQLHSKENNFICTTCGKGFPIKAYLVRHEKTHASKESFQCATCGEMFVTNSRLQIHLETHASTKMFDCDVCNSSFSEVLRLRRHLRNVHGIKRTQTNITTNKDEDS